MTGAGATERPFTLVRLAEEDLAAVVTLEKECYAHPWTVENFLGEFRRRITWGLGLKSECALAAQCFFWLIPPEIHLLNLAVSPRFRRRGLARHLVSVMVAIGRRASVETVYLEARSTNLAALRLYENAGFSITGNRPAYYEDGEDAVLMTLDLRTGDRA